MGGDEDDACGDDEFAGFHADEGDEAEGDGFGEVPAEEHGKPRESAGEDDGVGDEDGGEGSGECLVHSALREESGERGGGEKSEQEPGGGSGEVCGSGDGTGEDGNPNGALDEVKRDGGNGASGTEEHSEGDDGEGLERGGNGKVRHLNFRGDNERDGGADNEADIPRNRPRADSGHSGQNVRGEHNSQFYPIRAADSKLNSRNKFPQNKNRKNRIAGAGRKGLNSPR